ncbi:hypothetical protein AAG906_017842 [Vitis piasezkii]
MLTSKTKMPPNLCGKPLFAASGSLKRSLPTTVRSLTASPSEISARSSKSKIRTPHHVTLRAMDRKDSSKPKKIIPIEIGLPTIRTEARGQSDGSMELGRNLDWADEVRENASIRMADYQQRAAAHYNRKARPRVFKVGTLVLRKVFENTVERGAGNSKRIGKVLIL